MKNKIIAIVALLVLLAACLFAYEFVFKRPLVESPTNNQAPEDLLAPQLDIKEQHVGDQLTVGGIVTLPTPCHTLNATISPSNSSAYAIQITTTPPEAGVMCAQVLTERPFKVTTTLPAGETADLKLFIDGVEYKLNRFEVPAGTNFDDYQIQTKG